MKLYVIIIVIVCAGIFGLFFAASVAARPATQVFGAKEVSKDYKDGDMRVLWWGHSYRNRYRSTRLSSPSNRGYVGGGLHGGK